MILRNHNTGIHIGIDGIDTELLPDVFSEKAPPHTFIESVMQEADRLERSGVRKDVALRRARCAVPQSTSRLGLVVDMAIRMDDLKRDIRQTVPLNLAGRH